MICRLCLKDVECLINIFDELGIELNVQNIIAKHFWFEPKPDDPISKSICEACWHKVTDFNEFYGQVEEAHRLLNERFSFNFTANKARKIASNSKQKDEHDISPTTKKQSANDLNFREDFDSNATSNVATNSLANDTREANNHNAIELEEVVCSNNDATIDTDSHDFADHDEISTYLTLNEINEMDQDVLEQAPSSPAVGRSSKRVTRAALKEEKLLTHLDSLKSKKLERSSNTLKRARGRPKSNSLSNISSSNLPVKSLRNKICVKNSLKETMSSPPESSIDQLTKTKKIEQSYKDKIRKGNERIAQFLSLCCDVCNESQETFAQLNKHMMSKHSQTGFAICCNKKFYKRVALLDHVEKHLNPELFSCKECDKTFADKQCLKNHINIKHLPEEEKTFACEFCDKKFGRTYLLEQHKRTHKERNHICDVCQKGFPSLNQLKGHIKVIHNNYGTMCEICSKVIRGRAAFTRHMLQHEGIDLPKVQCPKCGSWHKDKYSLQKHIRRHNIDGTQHVCNECGKVAPNRSALLSHKRYVHKAERAFKCNLCKKAFKIQISLKEHMATHTGQALYKCPYCSRTFNSNANMHSHRKKMHPKEFAEARMLRQKQTLTEENNEIDEQQNRNEQDISEDQSLEHQQQLHLKIDGNNSNIIDLEDEDDDANETHILMTTDKFGELVFKVE